MFALKILEPEEETREEFMFGESQQVTCLVSEPGDTLEVPEFVLLRPLGCPLPSPSKEQ